MFLPEAVTELLKHIKNNDHLIDLENDKQSSYSSIYSLELVELEILKIHIKTNLKNDFI